MFITNGERRRFLMGQKREHPDAPPSLWDRFIIYCDNCAGFPDTFKQWVTR